MVPRGRALFTQNGELKPSLPDCLSLVTIAIDYG